VNQKPFEKIDIRIPVEAREALKELATADNVNPSDVARRAIDEYLRKRGKHVSFEQSPRGGDRRSVRRQPQAS
jgi:hypothetical protein